MKENEGDTCTEDNSLFSVYVCALFLFLFSFPFLFILSSVEQVRTITTKRIYSVKN